MYVIYKQRELLYLTKLTYDTVSCIANFLFDFILFNQHYDIVYSSAD